MVNIRQVLLPNNSRKEKKSHRFCHRGVLIINLYCRQTAWHPLTQWIGLNKWAKYTLGLLYHTGPVSAKQMQQRSIKVAHTYTHARHLSASQRRQLEKETIVFPCTLQRDTSALNDLMLPRKDEKNPLEIGPLLHETPCPHFSATRWASTFIYHNEMVSSPVLRKHSHTISGKLSPSSQICPVRFVIKISYERMSKEKRILLNKRILKLQHIRGTIFFFS